MAESMKGLHRSHRCTEVSSANIGEKVTVMGWVQKRRNLGSLIFIDLRDRSGLLQIVFDEESVGAEGFAKAGTLRSEYVVAVEGTVQKRSAAVNENLKTGHILKPIEPTFHFIPVQHTLSVWDRGSNSQTTIYFSILECIAGGDYTRGEIENRLGKAEIGGYLAKLEKYYSLISKKRPIFSKENSKQDYIFSIPFPPPIDLSLSLPVW